MKFTAQKIKFINVEDIKPNPYQSRRNFNNRKLYNLSESIKKMGIISPLLLRPVTNGFEIVCGSRRFRAALIAGLKSVPAIIINAGDRQCAELSLLENIQRENLSFFEEAEAFYNLSSYHGIKPDKISDILSLNGENIVGKMHLLSIEPDVRYIIEENAIPEKSAKELLKIRDPEKMKETAKSVARDKLSTDDISSIAKQINLSSMKKGRKDRVTNVPLCRNTVKKTVNLLKECGEKVDFTQNENEKQLEFVIRIRKSGVF